MNKIYSMQPPNSQRNLSPIDYAGAVAIVLGMVAVAFLLHRLMPHANLSLVFLTGVLIVSSRTGLGPSLVASVLSFLAFNFFFTPPYYTFEVADDGDVATLLFFLIMATLTGNLAARMHREMAEKRITLERTSNLYEFSRRMSSAVGTEQVLKALADHLCRSLNRSIAIFNGSDGYLPAVQAGESVNISDNIVNSARSKTDADVFQIDSWQFLKFGATSVSKALVAIHGKDLDVDQFNLARSLCDQAALALDRTQLVADLEQARLVSETEQLRSALLSSVSHDLRTPLATIIGSTTSLIEYGASFSDADRKELMESVVDESQRLDRYIQNLLDMTRLGQGTLSLQRDWVDVNDIIASSVNRLKGALKEIPVDIDIDKKVPLLWIHGVLIEQALVNLLDNAVRFTPVNGRISIVVKPSVEYVEILVCDQGPGIPQSEREKIFDMFYSVRQGDRSDAKGTGLGLAICRGMVVAHGGSVTPLDGFNGSGTCMQIKLPIIRPQELEWHDDNSN